MWDRLLSLYFAREFELFSNTPLGSGVSVSDQAETPEPPSR